MNDVQWEDEHHESFYRKQEKMGQTPIAGTSSPPAADDRAARASLVDELQALRTVQYECNECSVFDRVFEIVARHETTWQARMQAAESLAIGADLLVKQLESSWNVERDRADTAQALLVSMRDQRDALSAFKAYVHRRLDTAGVPTHPDGPHSAEGCRVGDRLDVLVGERDAAIGLLRRISEPTRGDSCPFCLQYNHNDGEYTHNPDCELLALLRPSPTAALPAAGDDAAERAGEKVGS